MSYVVTLEGFTPGARFDSIPWTDARIEESQTASGSWTALGTYALSPTDADPSDPQARNFTTTSANPSGYYRIVWLDASSDQQITAAVYSDQSLYQTTGVPFRDLVARLRAMSALSDPEAKARINQSHRRWVADCEANKVKLDLGPTEAGEDTYTLEQRIVSLRSLRVNGYRYERKSIDELEDLQASDAYVVGRYRGFFAQEFTPGGLSELLIYPTPTLAGQTISGRASVLPADMTADLDYPDLPADFHEDLIDDAFATVLRRDDERLGDADALEQRAAIRKKELVGRLTHRVGRGVARVKLSR